MEIQTEQEMIDFGKDFAKKISPPYLLELIGDVGAGKTTFTKGLALGLGIEDAITSPSFTISKRYPLENATCSELIHYDFYRIKEPGIMSEELEESLDNNNNIVIIEWSDSVKDTLDPNRTILKFTLKDEKTRILEIIKEQQ